MSTILRFGTDGWRARLDGDFQEENVVRVADAAASLWSKREPGAVVYVGYDTRAGARAAAVLSARVLASHGLDVRLARGYVPTPAVSWAVSRDDGACGALMVTGSHHPYDYLGIKFRVSDGGAGSSEFVDEVERMIDSDPTVDRGVYKTVDFVTPYLDDLVSLVDRKLISASGIKVVYDPMYGSGASHMVSAMRRLGIEVHEIHGAGDEGRDEMRPEPIEPWVDECEQEVAACDGYIGLVNDGDADRLAAVDERGRYVSPQRLMALILHHLVRNRGMSGNVALGLSTSTLVRRAARALGCRYVVKPVGFKHIYREMLKGTILMGGEETGGFGYPFHFPERDGLLSALLICELMAWERKTLVQLLEELEDACGSMSYARRDLRLANEDVEILRTVLPGLNPAQVAGRAPAAVSHMDGLRLEFDDESWLLLRPSGTETVVRVYAEAPTVELRDELLEAGCELARNAGAT